MTLVGLFKSKREVTAVKKYNASKKLVLLCTGIVGINLLLMITHFSDAEVIIVAIVAIFYFLLFWVLPAKVFMDGIEQRKRMNLLFWFLTVFLHVLAVEVWCLIIVTTSGTPYGADCSFAIVLLVMSPLLCVPVIHPVMIFWNMDQSVVADAESETPATQEIPKITLSGRNDPPSYNEVEGMDLPSYEELRTKRLKIGSNVIIVDENLKVSSFSTNESPPDGLVRPLSNHSVINN